MPPVTTPALFGAAAVDATDDHPLVAAAQEYAERVLRPRALETDATEVGSEVIDDLRRLGLLNHLAPRAYGGAEADRPVDRRIHEILAGACFNTWLVWAQHAPSIARLSLWRDQNPDAEHPLVDAVLRGELLVGAGISDVRRFPDRYLSARRAPGGWVFNGTVSWVSGWGLNSVLLIAAVDAATEEVVLALVPVEERTTASPLHLGAVAGSRTERVDLASVTVRDENVLEVVPLERWRAKDVAAAADARSHHFGLAATVLAELAAEAQPLAREVASVWAPRIADIRERAYDLIDRVDGGESIPLTDRLELKVASGHALTSLTQALVIARSGRGLAGTSTAQLHARSALFVLVQGQTDAVREAQLRAFAA
ncbi:acyl-CoA dehydrogenase family protein [Nocardioides sp. NPDC059952]|uniref:acyl-CoA dehydrogenase family protein n=1 Tax=Nocardioides sp. NPDC059952 TaxID=3347014 RepID=UPI00366A192D